MHRVDHSMLSHIENIRRNLKKARIDREGKGTSDLLDLILHTDTIASELERQINDLIRETKHEDKE